MVGKFLYSLANMVVSEGTLYVFIRGLRAKIACVGESQLLHTARGVGYTLRADVP